jgi:dTDP-4-dehydrorhamnose reductase
MGKVFSLPDLRRQAAYENQRRWLSFDLLCGRIDAHHPWYRAFIDAGIDQRQMACFVEQPCVPDIVGINHYVTSERFLDRRARDYPAAFHAGGVGYVDVQAVRVSHVDGLTGFAARLREVWERYRLPLAITEAHHGGARDDQLRWLTQAWSAAHDLRDDGVDIRAVTVWSILGCVDWNSLLMQNAGFYESGLFDVRCNPPRPTALAGAAAALASSGTFDHPVLDGPGWWQRGDRFFQPAAHAVAPAIVAAPRKLIITGGSGTLGRALSRICDHRSLAHHLLNRADMDIADEA